MARARNQRNGRLEEAMANLARSQENLLQNQALFVAQMAETNRRIDESNHRIEERFARIEAILFQHSQILNELTRMVERLPEAVREKIGFKPSDRPQCTSGLTGLFEPLLHSHSLLLLRRRLHSADDAEADAALRNQRLIDGFAKPFARSNQCPRRVWNLIR
jgi:hypothetical protein